MRISLFEKITCNLLFLTPLLCFSQDLKFDHYTVDRGLSQGNVWDIKQDKLGFIWVATEDGLNMFDGYTFRVFRNDKEDSTSLSNNNINSIQEDQDGNIWVSTRGGLNRYNREQNIFEQFLHNPDDAGTIPHNSISNVYVDSKNNVWVCTNGGLSLYNRTTNNFTSFFHDPTNNRSIIGDFVRCIVEDQNGTLWIGTMQGLSKMNPDGASFTNFNHDPLNENSLGSNQIMSIFADRDDNIWVGTFDNGLNMFNPSENSFTRYVSDPLDPTKLVGPYVYNISQAPDGTIWVSNDGGLCKLDRKTGEFQRYQMDANDDYSINSNTVTDVFFDLNSRMWVTTRFGGLNVYDDGKYVFKHFKHKNNDPTSLSANNVQGMDEDAFGNIWIGVDGGGLNKYDPTTGEFTHFRHDPFDKNSIASDKILCVEVDDYGSVWVGMWDGGVTKFEPETNTFTRYLHDPENPNSLSDDNIFDFLVDRDGELWIATWGNGISKYNYDTDDFTQYIHDPNDPNSIGGSSIVVMAQDHTGTLWLGSEDEGIYLFDKGSERFSRIVSGDNEGDLSANGIYSIYEDSNNRLWIGTSGAGLNLYERETQTFKVFSKSDGLPNVAIIGILEDDQKNLWLSTNKGISKFDPDSLIFKNYTISDGLQGDQFNRWAYLKTSTGNLIFGGVNGMNIFNPENIKDNQYKPPVYITEFRLYNKPVEIGEDKILKKNIIVTDEINLRYFENFISFDFTALNYRQTEKNQYKYMLVGLDEDWVDIGTERKASFTNLDPGDYTFRVIASNNNGVWNNEGASIRITITAPIWKTVWFWSLIGLLIVTSVVVYFRKQKVAVREQKLELERIIEEQTSEVKKQNEEILQKTELEKVRNWITEGLALFGEIISRHKGSLDALADSVLKELVKYVKAQQGAIALAEKEDVSDEHLKIVATYGISAKKIGNERIEVGEGMIGAAYVDKQIKTLDNFPDDYIKIESGLGGTKPKVIVLLPLKTDDGEILGVAELAFLEQVDETTMEFLEKVAATIALNIHAARLNQQTVLLLQQSKEQTGELMDQEEEMRQNMEELEATQDELKRREQDFIEQIEQLKLELKQLKSGKKSGKS